MGKLKKVLLLVLALCMMISIMSIAAAAEGDDPVAQIGSTTYASLADAVAAVPTDGTATTITMIADSVESGTITIAGTKNIVLDLNGHTVSYSENASVKNVYFITNKGTLTVLDTSEGALGSITYASGSSSYSYESVTVYNLDGTLNLVSGSIVNNLGGLAYAVNNSSNAWGKGDDKETVFNMTGGVLSAPNGDQALRVYQNCAQNSDPYSHNTVNITGGTILDTGIFVDNNIYQATAQTTGEGILIDINISGGTINGLIDLKLRHTFNTSLDITGGDFTNAKLRVRKQTDSSHVWNVQSEPTNPIVTISGGKWSFVSSANSAFNVSSGWTTTSSWTTFKPYNVTGGVFNVDLNDFSGIVFPEGKIGVANTDSATKVAYPYTVGFAIAPVAQIGDNYYASLADAIAAVPTDGTATTITMIADETVSNVGNGWLSIAATKSIVLDLNDHVISGVSDQKSAYFIKNYGELEIVDSGENGKITFSAVVDPSYSKENITIYNNGGTLTLTSDKIENTTAGGATYAVNNSSNAWGNGDDKDSIFNMNGGIISAPQGDAALRVYQNCSKWANPYSHNTVNITDGTILDTGIFLDSYIYQPDANTTGVQIITTVNISGGEIHGLIDLKLRHPFNTSLNITGGTFVDSKLWVRKVGSEWSANVAEPTDPMVHISDGKFSFVSGKAFGLAYDCGATSWTSYAQPYYVTGGVFNVDLNAFSGIVFPEGKTGVANTDSATAEAYPYTVGFAVAPVAKIGDNYYTSLADAIAAVPDNTATTITLLHDASLTSSVTIAGSKNIVVDLNNKTLTVNSGSAPRPIRNNGTLTFENGAIENTFTGTYGILDNYGTLYLTNVNVTEAPGDGGATFRNMTGGHTTVNGGTYTSTGASGNQSFRNHANATGSYLEINNATFVSSASEDYPLVIRAGVAVLNGITVNSIGSGAVCVDGGSVTISNSNLSETNASAGVYYAVYVSNSFGPSTVTINGGTYNGGGYDVLVTRPDGDNNGSEQNGNVSVTINAGAFTNNGIRMGTTTNAQGYTWSLEARGGTYSVDPTDYVASGYEAVNNGDGTWTVDKIKVAQIGTTKYTSLADAIAAANEMDGATVTLLRDYDMEANEPGYGWTTLAHSARENFLVISGNMTFDLGGHTLSNLFNNTFKITGNVTIQNGEMRVGQYSNGATCSYVMMTGEGANLVINNLTTFGGINVSAANATINNLSFSGTTFYAVCSQDNAVVTINNGTYTKAIPGSANYLFWVESGSTMNITGGSFTKGSAKFINGVNPVITGGTFDFDPTNSGVASGYEAVNNGNGTWTVDQIKVAQINGTTKYASLADAIAAAQAGDTITLLANIDLTATVNIEKSLTIDLNGKSITATNARALWVKSGEVAITGTGTISATKTANGSFASSSSVIRVGNSGTAKAKLTIGADVTVSTDYCYGVTVFGTNTNGVELVVNGNVTVTGTAAAISGNGNSGNKGNVTINAGADVTATADAAIYHPQGDYLTINGGSITGPVAVYQKSGTMTINGGTFTATAEAADYTPKGDGLTPTGDAIVIDNCGYPGGAPSASIKNATIANGQKIGYYVKETSAEGTVLADSVYTLNTNTEKEWVADTSVTGYSYRIATPTYVAQIGTTKYTSLADAITAANADTTSNSITITLLENIDFSTGEYADYKWAATYNPLTITRSNVTIDLDGHTISEMGNAALVFGNILAKDGRIENITIKNGTLRAGKTGNVTNSYVLGIAGVDGALVQNITTMGGINVYTRSKNVVIDSCNVAGTKYYTVCAQCGSDVTIKGTTYTKNTDSTVANKSMFWIQGAGTDSDMVTNENPTGAFDTSSITIESGNFTVDTSNGGVFYLISGVKPIVKGGYFNINPTAYVADGYAAVTSDLAGYTHKVVPYVEQSTTTVESTTTTTDEQSGTTTTTTTTTDLATAENGDKTQYVIKVETTTVTTHTDNPNNSTEQTNTTYKPVNVDVASNNNVDNPQVTATDVSASNADKIGSARTAIETDVTNAANAQSATFEAKLDENDNASSANVLKTTAAANAIAKAAATVSANQTENITDAKIELKTTLKSYTLADGDNSSVKATKIVYEIKPVAVLYNGSTPLGNAVELDNADIKEGETFTFTIPVPANMTATTVKVSHIGTDGYSTEIGTYTVQGTGSNRYVTVTVDHFSKFELEESNVSITGSCDLSAAISLKDSIDINFYVKNLAVGTSPSDYKVVYSFNGGDSKTYIGNEWTNDGDGKYKFVVASCAARQMNDTVTFEVLYNPYGNGQDEDYVSIKKVESYSIRQYCVNKINANSDQKLVEICRAVLDYGAEAQKYFGYKTNELANRENYGLTSKETSVSDTYNIAVASKKYDITKLSASLNTVSKTEINFYVSAETTIFSAHVTLNNVTLGETEVYVSESPVDGVYKITVKGIAARNLDNVYVLTVETEAGTTTLTYSALAYTYRKQDSSLSESGLSLAIYNYYLKAKAYFG